MPLSSGFLLGVIIALVGLFLYFSTRRKLAAKIVIGVGATIAGLTLLLIVLALNSSM